MIVDYHLSTCFCLDSFLSLYLCVFLSLLTRAITIMSPLLVYSVIFLVWCIFLLVPSFVSSYFNTSRCINLVCVYVNRTCSMDTSSQTGLSWDTSYTSINRAIVTASFYPNSWIIVADGIYEEAIMWQGTNVSMTSLNGPHTVVLDM